MDRVELIVYEDREILLIDLSSLKGREVYPVAEEAKKIIGTKAKNSVLALTDVANLPYNKGVISVLRDLTTFNKPYIKASAVVGVAPWAASVVKMIESLTGRTFHIFTDRESAKAWLVKQ